MRMKGENSMYNKVDASQGTVSREKDIAKLGTRVDDAKTDAMEFLTAHPDMKEKFDELGIDEDFMILEQGPKSSKT